MKTKGIIFAFLLTAPGALFGQIKISFPTPEIRVDTIKPLTGYDVTFMRPARIMNKLTIKGNHLPPTFYFHIVDSAGYNRFGVTKNGMVISGTHHSQQVNVDGLALIGRGNALMGADAFAIGKGVKNLADTTMAIGYYYTVPQENNNMTIIGYGGNRIEMDADSGLFVGNWKFNNDYSVAEQYTGQRWIDGKKIYQKTFVGAGSSIDAVFPHNISNLQHIIDIKGCVSASGAYACVGHSSGVGVFQVLADSANVFTSGQLDGSSEFEYMHVSLFYTCTDR